MGIPNVPDPAHASFKTRASFETVTLDPDIRYTRAVQREASATGGGRYKSAHRKTTHGHEPRFTSDGARFVPF
jgi:acyl-coenzyme A thioesterase PaaI-like protein